MKSLVETCYCGGSYSRLSKDDGDKTESDSIKNQKELIRNYQKSHPDIKIVEEYSDDGYSGVHFERPDFQRMMDDIKSKKINCIIVKDLSRFGRNYIEAGKYMEQILPFLGVRFIAINDNYDSMQKGQQTDQIMLPFKNLMNDSYCRDTSMKIRSNLNAKRSNGDFVGAFAPYGYKKDENNRNQLVIDMPAARVVKRIFEMKMNGRSNGNIADTLNQEGVKAPYEYKRHSEQGKNFKPSFKVTGETSWSVPTIIRTLQDEVYAGHLVQGKYRRPNYKVKTQRLVAKEEWIRVEDTHQAIILQNDFQVVQKLMLIDTRVAPGNERVYLLSGLLVCEQCGDTLIRRSVSSPKGKYIYYGCYTKGRKAKCKGVLIREENVEKAVLFAIQKHIEVTVEMESLLQHVDTALLQKSEVYAIEKQIKVAEDEIFKYKRLKMSLHNDYHEEIISQEEYIDLKHIYTQREIKQKKCIQILSEKKQAIINGKSHREKCSELFKEFRNIQKLDRKTLVMLVSHIYVSSSKKISIQFAYQDEFEEMCSLLQQVKEGE